MMKDNGKNNELIPKETFHLIEEYLKSIKYGQIILTVQDGKLIQIEKSEKIRLK